MATRFDCRSDFLVLIPRLRGGMSARALLIIIVSFAVGAVACNDPSNPITPTGTVVVDWDISKSSRPAVVAAKGAHTRSDWVATVTTKEAPPFKLDVHVEVAPIDYLGTEPVHQDTPVVVKISVSDNTGWDLSGKCLDGPNHQMPNVVDGGLVTPLGMMESCVVKSVRKTRTTSFDTSVTLEVMGDGTVTTAGFGDVKLEMLIHR